MGLGLNWSVGKTEPPNPDPVKFKIVKFKRVGSLSVLIVHYEGCTTHNGNKILVMDATKVQIMNLSKLDPHFLDGDRTLIARFPATLEGELMAEAFATTWSEAARHILVGHGSKH